MDAHETTGEIFHEVDWKKDGETGCLMTIVKVGAGATVLTAAVYLAYEVLAPVLVNLWW